MFLHLWERKMTTEDKHREWDENHKIKVAFIAGFNATWRMPEKTIDELKPIWTFDPMPSNLALVAYDVWLTQRNNEE